MDKHREKQLVIAEYLSGETSTRKLGIKYGYGHVTISRWVMGHRKQDKKKPAEIVKAVLRGDMPTDVAELQEALRLSRLKIDLLEAMIDISDEQFGTDIRKKAGTSQS